MYSMALLAIFFAGDMLGATMASRPGTQVSNTVLEFLPGTAWEPFHTCTGQDSMPIAWFNRRTNTSYFMSAQHERMVAGIAPSLDVTPTACSGRIFEGHDAHGYDSGPQSYANFQWLQVARWQGVLTGRVEAMPTHINTHTLFLSLTRTPTSVHPCLCQRHRSRPCPQRIQGRVCSTGNILLQAMPRPQPRQRQRMPRRDLRALVDRSGCVCRRWDYIRACR